MTSTSTEKETRKLLRTLTDPGMDYEDRVGRIVELAGNLPDGDAAFYRVVEWVGHQAREILREAREKVEGCVNPARRKRLHQEALAKPMCAAVRQLRKVARAERKQRAAKLQMTEEEWDDWAEWDALN